MNEKDDKDMDELMYYSPFSNQNKNQKSSKIKINPDNDSIFTVVIRLPYHKSFSFEVPQTWTTRKLLSFIKSTFKVEFKKSTPFFVFHGHSLSSTSESPLKDYFQPDKINVVIVTLKKFNQENNDENAQNNFFLKTNKEVFKSDEFCEMEKNVIDDYFKIFKNNSINNFPFMNPAYNHRREQIISNSSLDRLAAFEPIPLEEFPTRNYFQLNIIFKCFISFFAFGIYIKGFNFILFLSVLIGYYWYCINNVIDDFYKKKIQEIGISEEDYRQIKNGTVLKINGLNNKRGIFIIEKQEENDKKEKDEKKEEKKDTNTKDSTNINREANIKNDIEEDLKEEDKKDANIINEEMKGIDNTNIKENEKSPLLNNLNDIITNNNLRGQNNNIFKRDEKEVDKKEENKKEENKKEEDKKEEVNVQEEVRRESALEIMWEIIRVFFISSIPALCDEYEANNPMPINNNNNNDNNDNDDNNNDENNNNNNILNNFFNNFNNNNNNINNDINNNENNDNRQAD